MFIYNKLKNMFLHNTDAANTANNMNNDISLDEIDRLLLESENQEIIDTNQSELDTSIKSDVKDEAEKQLESTDKKPETEGKSEEKPFEKKDTLADKDGKPLDENKDTLASNDYTIVSKELIKSFTEEEQKTLSRYEGKPISEALKSLVEKQKEIGRLSSRKNLDVKPDYSYPDPTKNNDEAEQIKDKLINNNMKNIYSDYPTNEYEWAELQQTNPVKAHKYLTDRIEVARNINTQYDAAVHVQSNYHQINDDIIKEGASEISGMLKNLGLDIEKDFGIKVSEEEALNNFLDSLLVNKDGKLDLNVFETWDRNGKPALKYGVPIVKKDGFIHKFATQYLPHIVLKAKENAFNEGILAATSNKIPPSFSNSTTTKIRKAPSKIAIPETIEDLTRAIEESENSNNY